MNKFSIIIFLLFICNNIAVASPGICIGQICAEDISHKTKFYSQLIFKLTDQDGHFERVMIDCRTKTISPSYGQIDRSFAKVVGERACRIAKDSP